MARWIGPWALLLLPVAIGLAFLADSSGHGDGPAYRLSILRLHETGRLAPARAEWFHPGHYLLAWPLYAAGRWLGLSADPLGAIIILNHIGLGLAALAVYRVFRRLLPAERTARALLPAIGVATLPGFLWISQEALSDTIGHALVIIAACRLLVNVVEDERRQGALFLTGAVFGLACLVRVSSVLFAPMVALPLLYRSLRRRRVPLRESTWLALGVCTPIAIVFGWMMVDFGPSHVMQEWWNPTGDNTWTPAKFAKLSEVVVHWMIHVWRGLGPLMAVIVVLGIGRIATGAQPVLGLLFLGGLVMLLPYLWTVAMNRSPIEFRYQLPVMAFATIYGIGAVANWCIGRFGERALCLLAGIMLGANLYHAWPLLQEFRLKQSFVDAGAAATVELADRDALLVGGGGAAFLSLHRRGWQTMAVRPNSAVTGSDFWNTSWDRALAVMGHAGHIRRRILCFNECDLDDFRTHLRRLGWAERVLLQIPRSHLRCRRDRMLNQMDLDLFQADAELQVLELLVPPKIEAAVGLVLQESDSDLQFSVTARDNPGTACGLLIGRRPKRGEEFLYLGHLRLPFGATDDIVQHCLATWSGGAEKSPLAGHLDATGQWILRIPKSVLPARFGRLVAVAILWDTQAPRDAFAASEPVDIKR